VNIQSRSQCFKKSLLALTLASTYLPFVNAATDEQGTEIIEVTGRAAQFYFIDEATMATKTPTSFMDLPQSVQVLTSELITDQAARQTTDLYRSISGMTQFSYSGVTARGFRQDQVRYDGVQGDPYSGFSIPQLFNVESIEVLKGPTGMLYGAGQPGGLLNYVTKKPKFDSFTEFTAFAGNQSLVGASVETTGAVNGSDTLAYRLGAFNQQTDGFRNNTDEENTLISGGLIWLVNDKVDLTLQYDHIDQNLGGHRLRGVPVDGEGNFLTDISYSANEASDFQRLKANVVQLIANSEITNNLTNTTVYRQFSNKRTQQYHENLGLIGDLDPQTKALTVGALTFLGFETSDTAMLRQFRSQSRKNDEWSLTTDFVYEINIGKLEHTILFGADYSEVEYDYTRKFSDLQRTLDPSNPATFANPNIHVSTLDILNPVYDTDSSQYQLIDQSPTNSESTRLGIYLQDQVRINEQWIVIAGVRFDSFKDKDLLETNPTDEILLDEDNVSPRIGAIYQPNENTSIFVNRTEGFNPQSSGDNPDSEDLLSPETSLQHELGIKNKWLDGSLYTTVTAYEIVKDDVTVGNPNYIDGGSAPAQLQLGEVTSKGFEVDVVGDITEQWTGTINYAYNDAEITGESPDDIRNAVGNKFVNAPQHTLGMWTRYELPSINSAFAIGFDHVSDRISLSGQKVKTYTTWDASWHTTFDKVSLQINLKNIFDKEYATSGFNKRNGHFPGEPRTIVAQISYQL